LKYKIYASFTILRNYSTLYISIKFPITTHGKLFQTYNVLLFPVEVNSTHNHATQILDLPDYFLIISVKNLKLQECFISDLLLKNKFNIQLEVLVDLNNGLREQCFVLSPRQFGKIPQLKLQCTNKH
jgi:hypothetical protein